MEAMKTFYDVQQFLKQFGIIVYMGKRLYDIELMKLELSRIYDAGLMDKLDYLEAESVIFTFLIPNSSILSNKSL